MTIDFVPAFSTAAARVVETIPACDMGTGVNACPGWSSYDVVVHLGNVHAWAATIVETGRHAERLDDHPRSHRAATVTRWYAAKAEDLLQVLRVARPEADCWTLSEKDRTCGFWARRQTHETLVHLADLGQVAGRTAYIPAALAADGIGEVLEVFLPRMHTRGRKAELAAPLLLNADDTGDTWLLTPTGEGPPRVEHVSDSELVDAGTDLVTAPAADLMLLLWKRIPVDDGAVTLDGDRTRLLAFLASPLTP